MYDNRAIKFLLEIYSNKLYILKCWFYKVDRCYSMQLLPFLLQMKVKRDIIISQIF